jgi:hypothetical protein
MRMGNDAMQHQSATRNQQRLDGAVRCGRGALAILLLAVSAAACTPAKSPTVSLRMNGKVPAAMVMIDERYVGSLAVVARRGVALPVGTHRITVERQGYFPYDRLVEVHAGDPPLQLDVVLTPIPD